MNRNGALNLLQFLKYMPDMILFTDFDLELLVSTQCTIIAVGSELCLYQLSLIAMDIRHFKGFFPRCLQLIISFTYILISVLLLFLFCGRAFFLIFRLAVINESLINESAVFSYAYDEKLWKKFKGKQKGHIIHRYTFTDIFTHLKNILFETVSL